MIKLISLKDGITSGFVDIIAANKIAVKNTLNTVAFLSRRNAHKKIDEEFIVRNKFVKSNIRVDKAVDGELSSMQSEIGATEKADFMEIQEFGGNRIAKKTGSRIAIPQVTARGGNRKNLVRKENYLKLVKKSFIRPSGNIVRDASKAKSLNKFIIHKHNIYKITSFIKRRNSVTFKKVLVYQNKEKSVRIKGVYWLRDSIDKPMQDSQNIYNSQIKKMLKSKEII